MQIIKKLFFSHVSVNRGLIQHVVHSCYNYNITFRKLAIHTVKMRPISACYTSGRGNSLNRALFELRPLHYKTTVFYHLVFPLGKYPKDSLNSLFP